MQKRNSYLVIGLLLGLWWGYSRLHRATPASPTLLPASTRERVLIDTSKKVVTVVTHAGESQLIGVRHAQIDIGTDGRVSIVAHRYGVAFEPGIAVGTSGRALRVGLDSLLVYFGRTGLVLGCSIGVAGHPRLADVHLYPALVCQIPTRFTPNTSFYIGSNIFNFGRDFELGLRVGF